MILDPASVVSFVRFIIAMCAVVAVLVVIATVKYKLHPLSSACFILMITMLASIVAFGSKDHFKRAEVLEGSSLVYEDLDLYINDETGEYFKLECNENGEYYRYLVTDDVVETLREYKEGIIGKAEDVEVLIDSNGNYVVIDENGNRHTTATDKSS